MKEATSYLKTIQEIAQLKKIFEHKIERELSLTKVPCPLFIKSSSGLQDQLSGFEKSVGFIKENEKYEIVHSLAKWKRKALGLYKFPIHTGLYTDMKAIRKDEKVDPIHSLYVEQWDWEKVITESDRTIEYLKQTVKSIYKVIRQTSIELSKKNNKLLMVLPKTIYFITTQELEDLYPTYNPSERENIIVAEKKAVFIIGVGDKLKSGKIHDLRSPDYDDWSLNGDLLIYDKELSSSIEISSMGIRVDEKSIISQLKKSNCMDRKELPYHKQIIKKELPYTIGGGIGVSRLCMLLLKKQHIAEVQASSWPIGSIENEEYLEIL